ncbi:flagellar basal body protein [Undibacterium sp. TS12]|uniref:flagellar basal body rod protein FlgB n=1 Tax=Undibacterium sp. TS12 TaxID=2908202 RepID=UPI001F4C7B3E|nr:flagellar basal body protein [Undibacterium sp. TS12]MCH8618729.1 flagellar basal body protein [Undibacterium sp. TS12]
MTTTNLPVISSLPLQSAEAGLVAASKSTHPNGVSFAASLARLQEKVAMTISKPVAMGRNIVDEKVPANSSLVAVRSENSGSSVEVEENILHERALALRAFRQQLLASNIANADTPGYKAVDFDIQEAIRAGKTIANVQIKYVVSGQSNIDGNTVETDREMAKFTENALMYQYQVDRVRSHYKDMEELLKNTPY